MLRPFERSVAKDSGGAGAKHTPTSASGAG